MSSRPNARIEGRRTLQTVWRGLLTVLLLALGAGCSTTGESVGVWDVADGEELSPDTTSFQALVNNVQCTSGREPVVEDVLVESDASSMTVTVMVRSYDGDQDCQGTPPVSHVIDLGERLGDRVLIDGGCLPGQQGRDTALCPPDEIRFSPE
tara:strand:- start:258 stop:713 length:456 start_codon:yes stop_codon:yes gene_type:complete